MNGNFRNPQFVKRYEYTYYDLDTPLNAVVPNNARQTKNGYKFAVDNSSEANPIDWYNAYFEVDFKLVTLADSDMGIVAGVDKANKFCTATNGQTFIKEIKVECNGTSVYANTRANESSNGLSLLKYTKSYADTVGKDQFFYLDTAGGTAEPRPNQALYNEGFERRKILTDGGNTNKNFNSFEFVQLFCHFQEQSSPQHQNRHYCET